MYCNYGIDFVIQLRTLLVFISCSHNGIYNFSAIDEYVQYCLDLRTIQIILILLIS